MSCLLNPQKHGSVKATLNAIKQRVTCQTVPEPAAVVRWAHQEAAAGYLLRRYTLCADTCVAVIYSSLSKNIPFDPHGTNMTIFIIFIVCSCDTAGHNIFIGNQGFKSPKKYSSVTEALAKAGVHKSMKGPLFCRKTTSELNSASTDYTVHWQQ